VGPEGFETSAIVVGEYQIDDNTTVRAKTTTEKKINDNSKIGVGITQRVSPGVKVTVGAEFNPKSFLNSGTDGGHSVGFQIDFQE